MYPGRSEGAGEGLLRGAEVADVVETLCLTSREGILEVQSEAGVGKIAFRSGRVLHAEVAGLEGEPAFSKMVGEAGGDFRLLPLEAEKTVTITRPWEDLLIEAVRNQELERADDAPEGEPEADTTSLYRMVRRMKLAEKVRFALKCGKEGRALLIHDGSRAVQLAVITNPRITNGEIALIACSKTIDEEVLRRVADNREWIRYYPVRLALASNAKTPLAIASKMLPTLMPQDISQIARSKDVSAFIAVAARRLLVQKG